MKLYELLENNAVTAIGDTEITSVTDDTRKITEGSLFVCVKGGSFDGHSAAAEMLEKGAATANKPTKALQPSLFDFAATRTDEEHKEDMALRRVSEPKEPYCVEGAP